MNSQPHRFTNEKLLEILALSQNATAIYTGEEITIQSANNMMLGFWGKDKNVIGLPLVEAVPELADQAFPALLRGVWLTGITHERKDALVKLKVNGKLQDFYFDYVYRAIKNEDGDVDCILHTATDVTELNLGRNLIAHAKAQQEALNREQALNEELGSSNEELAAALEELSATNEELQQTQDSLQRLNEQLEAKVEARTRTIIDLNQELEAFNEELTASNEELISANEALSENRLHLEKSVIELSASEYRTRSIIESAPFPIGIYIGREMRITFANQAIADVWGKGNDIVGKLYSEVLPELSNQQVYDQLDLVFTTGEAFQARNQRIDLVVNGELKIFYFNYNFTALRTEAGEIYGVMNTAADVTDVVLSKQEIEKSATELATLNKEFADLNEELAAVNEELTASNEEQAVINQQLTALNDRLNISQDELKLAIDAAGMATFDLNPLTGKFAGNELTKSWFGLQPEEEIELSKATDVIAEADRERVLESIQNAMDYESGGNYDTYYTIINPNSQEPKIVRAKGKALFNEHKQPLRLSGVLQDVTEQVTSQDKMRKLIESLADINTRLNIAMDAGSMGSTEVDLATGIMQSNEQFKKLFGRPTDKEFTYPEMFEAMLPKYREPIRDLVSIAKKNNTTYRGEYEVMWPDGSIHWISAHGRPRYDSQGNAVKMVGILSDVTELKQDEQRKNDFIAMVSHELKTPLTSLTAYVQILQAKAKTSGDTFAVGALEKAGTQTKKMTTMINGFLNVSRLESGKIHIENQRFDMALLVREVESESILTITSHNVVFEPVEEIFVNADRDKIGQVINNFLSNAVKYSPAGTTINVACVAIDGRATVAVRDEGNGIKPEDQQKLFERYYRVKDQPVNIAGFGIGLYLCAEVIHRHNGRIWVESEPGKGSTFYFSLPI